MKTERKRIKEKFFENSPKEYWGDDLDVRYYLVSQLKLLRNEKILEIGCGTGIILSELNRENEIFGVDKNLQYLAVAKKLNPYGFFVNADINELFFPDEFFDVIILAAVIECLSDKDAILLKINRMLKKGGKLYITSNNKEYSYYINQNSLLTFKQLDALLKPYFNFKLKPYNPVQPVLFFLPKRLKKKMDRKYQLMIPSLILSEIPFIDYILELFMNMDCLKRISKSFYIEAIKNQ